MEMFVHLMIPKLLLEFTVRARMAITVLETMVQIVTLTLGICVQLLTGST